MQIAEKGYTHEKICAFYPVCPILWKIVGKLFPFLLERTQLLLGGFLVCNISNTLAMVYLYKLTKAIFNSQNFAVLTLFLYSITPASIFTMALYTEPVFAFTSFAGMYYLFVSNNLIASTILFMLSAGCRSNGITNALFVFIWAVSRAISLVFPLKRTSLTKFLRACFTLAFGAVSCFAIALPTVLHEESQFSHKCIAPTPPSLYSQFLPFEVPLLNISLAHRIIRRYAVLLHVYNPLHKIPALNNILFGGFNDTEVGKIALREWCVVDEHGKGGSIYGFIQGAYWSVGPFRYFTLKQLPRHFMALPISLITVCAVVSYTKHWYDLSKQKKSEKESRKNGQTYFSFAAWPFVLHLAILFLVSYPIINIEVMTRFLNACPPIFWFVASILEGWMNSQGTKRTWLVYLLLFFFIGFAISGAILFPMFMPWT
ncbi:putative GPI mannosyltransferase 2 [Blattamonas nauphoetae]|uniref:GPI mannosyltransferase 2 n=1 Tax=Blattamonas nauphoetae TaxID=2049346 RepID=A0ABQ9X561_9EUKA|nr:putative GPI mannosyltransferase 2 [Blattamonas nauphoetae]